MNLANSVAALLLMTATTVALSAEKWMTIVTAKGGYEFKGVRKGDRWSFVVPGSTIRTKDDNGRMFADIDGVIVQALTVPLTDFSKASPLDQHRAFETDYLTKAGASVSNSSVCSATKLQHREWKVSFRGKLSTFLSFVTKTNVLVVVVARDQAESVMFADSKLRAICASLKV